MNESEIEKSSAQVKDAEPNADFENPYWVAAALAAVDHPSFDLPGKPKVSKEDENQTNQKPKEDASQDSLYGPIKRSESQHRTLEAGLA